MSHSARSHAAGADVPALQLATSQAPPYAVVIKWNDRDVHGGCRIMMPCATGPKRRRRAPRLRRLVGHGSSFESRCAIGIVAFGGFESAQAANSICPFPLVRKGRTEARRRCASSAQSKEPVRSKLRTTWAAAPDGAQAPAVWASRSSLRAGPVSWQLCARVGWLQPSRGSCARTVFHTPCDASTHEKHPRVASSF